MNCDLLKLFVGPLGAATVSNLSDKPVSIKRTAVSPAQSKCRGGSLPRLQHFYLIAGSGFDATSPVPRSRTTAKRNGQFFGVEENLAGGLVAYYLSGARVEFVPDPLDEDQHAG